MTEQTERPRVTSYGSNGQISIRGLTKEGVEAIQGMLLGANYVSFDDKGNLIRHDRIARLPDPLVEPFERESWVHSNQVDGVVAPLVRKEWGEPGKNWDYSIYLQHLCGYNYTPDNYRREARRLQSFGFECLRSRRANDGKRYEVWYLPGLWMAEGELKAAFQDKFNAHGATDLACEDRRKKIVRWLCANVSCGCINLTTQAAAMCVDPE